MTGFYIKQLSVQGEGKTPADLIFNKGVNIITGASDTGKSYAFTAINFILSRSVVPSADIPEAFGYTDFLLEIRRYSDDKPITLRRNLNGNQIHVKECELSAYKTSSSTLKKFKVTGSISDNGHISTFLLGSCNLNGKSLLKNKITGKTINLGIKSLLKLISIDEERIITKKSPFYFSDNDTLRIADKSMLKVLLTGQDFDGTEEVESKEIRETRINGKIELITSQILNFSAQKEEIINRTDVPANTIDISFLENELIKSLNNLEATSEKRKTLIVRRENIVKKQLYNDQLLSRFEILHKQYLSDYQRLEFIVEADSLSSQLMDVHCPICSSKLDSNHIEHMTEIKNFRESVFAEIRKIHPKMSDLIKSIENLRNETKSLIEEKNTIDNDIQILMNQVEHTLTPEIEQLKYQWNNFAIITEKTNRVMFIDEQITRLFDEKDRMLKMLETKIEKDKSEILGYTDLASLSNFIEKRLSKWNYENSVKVNFDSSHLIFDITISGKSRSSYGKGKRSISYIACVLGLMDYCIEKEKDFPGFTIFDSPLTTFEEKKNQLSNEDEKISDSILKSFFQDLSNTTNDRQIIIFDNKEPMQPFREKINTIIFTGVKGNGRCGFFPA